MAEIHGTEDDDVLSGKPGASASVFGFGGNDTLTGSWLADSLDGGDGDDFLLGGGGSRNVILGGLGSDTLIGVVFAERGLETFNLLDGGEGDDRVVGGLFDTLIGGDGDDTLEGQNGLGDFRVGSGDDVVKGELYGSTLDGGDGTDTLVIAGEFNLAKLTSFEILEVGYSLTATAEQLDQFSIIRAADPSSMVRLKIEGDVDLRGKLGDRAADILAGFGVDKIIVGDGDDSVDARESGTGVDRVDGRGGNDTLNADGRCKLIGGAGDDVLSGGRSDTLLGGEGDDQIFSACGKVRIDAGVGHDDVNLSVRIKSGSVDGGDGFDRLIADGDISAASLSGFEALLTTDTLIGTAAQFESFDTIAAEKPNGFANLQLAGAATVDLGEELAARRAIITGSNGDDAFTAGSGDDVLRGGRGDDTIRGGAGSDRFFGDAGYDNIFGDAGDDIIELSFGISGNFDGGSGRDRLFGSVSRGNTTVDLSQSQISQVEVLDTLGRTVRATADQFEGFDSIVTSRPRADVKLELSDAGTVDLERKLGGHAAQVIGSEGDDAIRSGAAGDRLDGGAGADRLDGAGGDDRLEGGEGADTLIGGDGRDTLSGWADDDLYVIHEAQDIIREDRYGGIDTVQTSINYELTDWIENLRLIGTADLDATGSRFENVISGNAGDNAIDGASASDTLRGGAGDDTFIFSTDLGKTNVDTVLDFVGGADKIHLDGAIFDEAPLGALDESAFKIISDGKIDADDRILYDRTNGRLLYDPDGMGGENAIVFATLINSPKLAAADLFVV